MISNLTIRWLVNLPQIQTKSSISNKILTCGYRALGVTTLFFAHLLDAAIFGCKALKARCTHSTDRNEKTRAALLLCKGSIHNMFMDPIKVIKQGCAALTSIQEQKSGNRPEQPQNHTTQAEEGTVLQRQDHRAEVQAVIIQTANTLSVQNQDIIVPQVENVILQVSDNQPNIGVSVVENVIVEPEMQIILENNNPVVDLETLNERVAEYRRLHPWIRPNTIVNLEGALVLPEERRGIYEYWRRLIVNNCIMIPLTYLHNDAFEDLEQGLPIFYRYLALNPALEEALQDAIAYQANFGKHDYRTRLKRNACAVMVNDDSYFVHIDRDVLAPESIGDSEIRLDNTFPDRSIGIAYTQGRRREMEDAHFVGALNCGASVMGVFDGHRGPDCSGYVAANLLNRMEEQIGNLEELSEEQIYNGLKSVCRTLHENYDQVDGTTLTVAMTWRETTWIIQLGDSRALGVFPETGQIIGFTEEAKVRGRYLRKVSSLGGYALADRYDEAVYRLNGNLNLCRAIGDGDQVGMSHEPKITKYQLRGPGYLILTCDGVFEHLGNKEVGEAVNEMEQIGFTPQEMAYYITAMALRSYSRDNITVIVHKIL